MGDAVGMAVAVGVGLIPGSSVGVGVILGSDVRVGVGDAVAVAVAVGRSSSVRCSVAQTGVILLGSESGQALWNATSEVTGCGTARL